MTQAQAAVLPRDDARDGFLFVGLACAITWALATPLALAWSRHEIPSSGAMAGAGLSAFGPTLAALAIGSRRGDLRETFGRWRTNVVWIPLALFAPAAVHLIATALYAVLGGHPTQWFHPPSTPEQIAALVVFPIGEEFGWRGFAHPRMVGRFGLVKGSLVVGAAWGVWHLAYGFTPAGVFDWSLFAMTMIELPLYALPIAWVFERSGRSMAVAIAFHAGAHLDHFEVVPTSEWKIHTIHLAVAAVVALFAARSLARREPDDALSACGAPARRERHRGEGTRST